MDKFTILDVAKAAGIAIASLYRYYSTKPKLVMAISTWAWDTYAKENERIETEASKPDRTAAEIFESYLDSFLDLYHNHRNLLRFNQFFNVYLVSEDISEEEMGPYLDMVRGLERRFDKIYQKALQDGTLRTDIPQRKMFSATLHLMLAVVTRYAVGLVYNEDSDPEEELLMQKDMLMRRFVTE